MLAAGASAVRGTPLGYAPVGVPLFGGLQVRLPGRAAINEALALRSLLPSQRQPRPFY